MQGTCLQAGIFILTVTTIQHAAKQKGHLPPERNVCWVSPCVKYIHTVSLKQSKTKQPIEPLADCPNLDSYVFIYFQIRKQTSIKHLISSQESR